MGVPRSSEVESGGAISRDAPAGMYGAYRGGAELGVISTSLFRFKGPFGAHWENISAGAVLVILPTLVVLLFLQRYIHNGFTQGGESCYRFSSHS